MQRSSTARGDGSMHEHRRDDREPPRPEPFGGVTDADTWCALAITAAFVLGLIVFG